MTVVEGDLRPQEARFCLLLQTGEERAVLFEVRARRHVRVAARKRAELVIEEVKAFHGSDRFADKAAI
jgi:hypothetical protein